MQFLDFIQQKPQYIIDTHSVLCFTSQSGCPALFFSSLFSYLRTQNIQIKIINVQETDESLIKMELETTFLGNRFLYWLSDLNMLDSKKKRELEHYLVSYKGPHTVAFFNEGEMRNIETIVLPASFDMKQYSALFNIFYNSIKKYSFSEKIFKKYSTLPIEQCCLLMQYHILMGNSIESFTEEWLDKLVVPDKSLFNLSSYFFAKKEKTFFQAWSNLSQQYAPLFWISFWSEQLFRAHGFIEHMLQKNNAEAKKIAHRLPFTFIQKDWHSISLAELKMAHNKLYLIDHALKNGGSETNLELWYLQFFLKTFLA